MYEIRLLSMLFEIVVDDLAVGQSYLDHLRCYRHLCKGLYPPPIPQNLRRYQERTIAVVYCDSRLYLERGHLLWSGHILFDFPMHPSCEDLKSPDDHRSLLRRPCFL